MLLVGVESVELLAAASDAALVPTQPRHLPVGADAGRTLPGLDVLDVFLLDVEHSGAALGLAPVRADPLLGPPIIFRRVPIIWILP